MKTVMQLTDEILNASPEAQIMTRSFEEASLPEITDKQRDSMLNLSESNARIIAKKAMQGEAPKNAREKRAVRAKLDKSPSKAKKVGLDVAAAAYEGIKSDPGKKFQSMDVVLNPPYTRDANESRDDRGRTNPGSAADGNSKTIGKFRSQPGAGPGQAKRNALAKKEAEAKAKTADGDTNEARGIGGKWDTPSQKYSADRMRDFTPPTPEQVKKERARRLKAGLNADGSKKTKGDEKNESLTGHEISVLKEAASIMKKLNKNSKKLKAESTTCGAIGVGALKPVKAKVSLLKNNKKKKTNESFNHFLDNIIHEVKSN